MKPPTWRVKVVPRAHADKGAGGASGLDDDLREFKPPQTLPLLADGVPPPPSGHPVTDANDPPTRITAVPMRLSASAVERLTGSTSPEPPMSRPHAPG